jgi:beta-alanine degradation protein BauB
MADPVESNPDLYRVVFENERVRVLEYLDHPGDATTPHSHPDSVMVTLSSFRRRLSSGDREVEVEIPAFQARWLDAQEHSGANIGDTDTHTIFVELKEPNPGHGSESIDSATLGPREHG